MTIDPAKMREWARLAKVADGGDTGNPMNDIILGLAEAVPALIEALVEERARCIYNQWRVGVQDDPYVIVPFEESKADPTCVEVNGIGEHSFCKHYRNADEAWEEARRELGLDGED